MWQIGDLYQNVLFAYPTTSFSGRYNHGCTFLNSETEIEFVCIVVVGGFLMMIVACGLVLILITVTIALIAWYCCCGPPKKFVSNDHHRKFTDTPVHKIW